MIISEICNVIKTINYLIYNIIKPIKALILSRLNF